MVAFGYQIKFLTSFFPWRLYPGFFVVANEISSLKGYYKVVERDPICVEQIKPQRTSLVLVTGLSISFILRLNAKTQKWLVQGGKNQPSWVLCYAL
jgi:hypothetical protein